MSELERREKLAKEARERGLYYTGGEWCDWMEEKQAEIERLKQANDQVRRLLLNNTKAETYEHLYPSDFRKLCEMLDAITRTTGGIK